jgi:integrase
VLHRAVGQAVRWGWLARNPVSAATRPTVQRPTITPPAAEQVRAALARVRRTDPDLWCWLLVALATGARRGEVCGIRWGALDLDARTVRIESSVSQTTRFGVAVKSTKTGRCHAVALTACAAEALAERREASSKAAVASQGELCREGFVFSSDPLGRIPWRPSLVTRRWATLREDVGIGRVRVHDLRHFVATELLTAGIDVRTVANRLGHARPSTTLDVYWAFVPARDHEAAEHLGSLLES